MADGKLRNGVKVRLNIYPCSGVALERAVIRGEGFSCELDFPQPERKGDSGRLTLTENRRVSAELGKEDWLHAFGFYEETAGFLDAIRAGRAMTNDLRSALQSVEIMGCIRNRSQEYPAVP